MAQGLNGWWLGYNRYDEETLLAEARLILDGLPPQRVSQLQRQFRLGYNRASRLHERLEQERRGYRWSG